MNHSAESAEPLTASRVLSHFRPRDFVISDEWWNAGFISFILWVWWVQPIGDALLNSTLKLSWVQMPLEMSWVPDLSRKISAGLHLHISAWRRQSERFPAYQSWGMWKLGTLWSKKRKFGILLLLFFWCFIWLCVWASRCVMIRPLLSAPSCWTCFTQKEQNVSVLDNAIKYA